MLPTAMFAQHFQRLGALALALSISTLLSASPPTVQAQGTPTDDDRGRMHFQAGRDHLQLGHYEEALREFELAYDLSRRSAMLLNIANAAERLAAYPRAADAYQSYAETLAADDPERATYAARAASLRERAERAEAEAITGAETPAAAALTTAPTPSHDLLVPGAVLLAVGGASVVVGAILGGLALGEQSSVQSGCGATRSCLPSQVAAMDDLALGSDIALFGGLALAAVGGVLLVLDLTQGGGESSPASARLSIGLGDLSVQGTF